MPKQARPRARPSTERATGPDRTVHAPLPLAEDFERVQGLRELLEVVLGVKGSSAIRSRLSDEAFVRSRVDAALPVVLAVLEVLIDVGGAIRRPALDGAMQARHGVAPEQMDAVIEAMKGTGLAVQLVVSRSDERRRGELHVSLLDVASGVVAVMLRGLSVPRDAPAPDARRASTRTTRDEVASLAALAHFQVRATTSGFANRTSTRKLGLALGLDGDRAGVMIDRASQHGLVGERDGRLLPRVAALRALARGESQPHDELGSWAHAHVQGDRWVSLVALRRARMGQWHVKDNIMSKNYCGALGVDPDGARFQREEADLRKVAGLTFVEHAGTTWVRRTGHVPGGGDGHITPAFEVMLGPEADPDVALDVALAAEPVRFDTVLTFKLTPASVAAACALGLDASAILAALARVGRHAVPDNVAAMVSDWARGARTGTLRKAWVLETSSPDAADAAVRALGASVLARPSPTSVLIDDALDSPGPLLGKSGIQLAGDVLPSHAFVEPRASKVIALSALDASPSPALVTRFEAERASGLRVPKLVTVREDLRVEGDGVADFGDEADEDWDDVDDGFDEGPAGHLTAVADALPASATAARSFLLEAAALWSMAEDDFLDWAARRGAREERSATTMATSSPLLFLGFIALGLPSRRAVLRDARDAPTLIELSLAHVEHAPNALSPRGREAMRRATAPDVSRHLPQRPARERGAVRPVSSPPSEVPTPAAITKRPAPVELGERSPEEVVRAFELAMTSKSPVWLRVRSKSQGDRAVHLLAERVLVRGSETTLLGTDVDTELGRSFPLANVASVVAG